MPENAHRITRSLAAGLVLLASALLAACAPATTQRASQPVRTTQVDLPPSYKFAPDSVEVAPGTTVTWTNHDNFTHTVQVQGQAEVHTMRPGESASIRFDQPGTYPYVCTLHTQNMQGTVVVG